MRWGAHAHAESQTQNNNLLILLFLLCFGRQAGTFTLFNQSWYPIIMTANQCAPPESLAKTSIFMPKPYDFVLDALRNNSGNIKTIEVITFNENGLQYCFHCCNKELLGDESAKCECPLCLQKNKSLEITIPEVTVPREEFTLSNTPVVEAEPKAIVLPPKQEIEIVPESQVTPLKPVAEIVPKRKVTPRKRKPKIIHEATDSSSHSVGKKILKNGTLQKNKTLKSKNDTEKKTCLVITKSKIAPEKKTCQYCKNIYYSISNLNRHVRRSHMNHAED